MSYGIKIYKQVLFTWLINYINIMHATVKLECFATEKQLFVHVFGGL